MNDYYREGLNLLFRIYLIISFCYIFAIIAEFETFWLPLPLLLRTALVLPAGMLMVVYIVRSAQYARPLESRR